MKTFLKVFFFNVALIAFFLYVGNSIPQQRKDPPKELELSADMSQADFVKAGEQIFYGKGTCALCHTIGAKGERCPNLAGMGPRANTRVKEEGYKGTAKSGPEYLVESLHNPGVYVVEGYQPSMPPLGRQLNDLEMVAMVAFLQNLDGEVTVDGNTRFLKYRGTTAEAASAPAAAPAAAPATAAVEAGKSAEALLQQYACNTCHNLDKPGRLVGPSLWDIGARQSVEYIRESLLLPDAKIAEGYPPQVMTTTLQGNGFYQKVALQDLNALVDYLASLKGGK
jgi:cytochrome c2